MITTAIIYNIGRGLCFNVILPLWYVANQILGMYYCVVTCSENDKSYSSKTTPIKNPDYALADFKNVDDALSEIPNDLSVYTQESVEILNKAIAQVNRNTANNNQEQVDEWAEEIREAIKQLVLKRADYSELEKTIEQVPSDLSIYTEKSVSELQEIISDIDYSLNITQQKQVDEYAEQLRQAIENLEKECWFVRVFKDVLSFCMNMVLFIINYIKSYSIPGFDLS